MCDDLCVLCYSKLLSNKFGLVSKNGRGKTIGQIAEEYSNHILILRTDGHLTCSIDGDIYDIWNCSNEICDIFWIAE